MQFASLVSSHNVFLSMRLSQQPLRQVAGSIIVLKVRRQFPPIRILIIKPGISYPEYRSFPNPRNRDDHMTTVREMGLSRGTQPERTQFLDIDLMRRPEYRILSRQRKSPHLIAVPGHFMIIVKIDLDPQRSRQHIEMLEL